MICAIIPAKGLSYRLPRKNVKQFCGKPLLAWTLIQTKYSLIDETFVSTDDDEIAQICEQYGATVHWREHEGESDGDIAGGVPQFFLRKWIYENRADVDMMVHMFCTSPLRRPGDIDAAIRMCRRERLRTNLVCLRYDTFIHRIIARRHVVQFLADKNYSYADPLTGFSVVPAELDRVNIANEAQAYRGEWWKGEKRAKLEDPKVFQSTMVFTEEKDAPIWAFVECEPWQIVEIDYEYQFDVAEYYMQKYILKDGEDVYERYYTEHYGKAKTPVSLD